MRSEAETIARLARERLGRELPPERAGRIAGQVAKVREVLARARAKLPLSSEPSHHRPILESVHRPGGGGP